MRKILIPLLVLLSGCSSVANRSIRTTYASYNQTIAYNQSQQMLLNLVRLRYRELPMFLKVGALSSSFNFEMHGGANFGRSFAEQTWGLSAGSSFSSRPTITYTPIEGNTFVKQLLGEIDQNTFVLLFRSGWPIRTLCHVMVERIQQQYNNADEPTFENFLATVAELEVAQDENRLNFVTSEDKVYIQVTASEASIEGVDADSPQVERMVPFADGRDVLPRQEHRGPRTAPDPGPLGRAQRLARHPCLQGPTERRPGVDPAQRPFLQHRVDRRPVEGHVRPGQDAVRGAGG